MRTLIVTLLFTIVATGTVHQPKWKTFSSPDGSFSVLFPDNPTENKQTLNTAAGPINSAMYISKDDNATNYMVGYTDYPEANIKQVQPDKMFDGGRDRLIASEKGKLITQSTITLAEYPGRAITVEMPDGLIVTARLYLVKNRFYQLLAETKRTKEDAEKIASFLDSFKLADGKKA